MTTTLPAALRAPFSSGGSSAIDAALANKLLGIALEAGGDYADIYFEFRVQADYSLEDEQVKTLGVPDLRGRCRAAPRRHPLTSISGPNRYGESVHP